ncbi:C-factor [Araneus ventricosus]|uniref:C-factor n=1 Tax=Araneus ventricosus TaxID=182803 RepID=A0A4Y2C4S3_ARAVE|nr:C-factor [Araneus ventricosus]
MEVNSVLVTGANQGIGLEFVKQFVNLQYPPRHVFATYRNINTVQTLENIKNLSSNSEVILIKMDVREASDIKSAFEVVKGKVGDQGLNLLINNAGAVEYQSFPEVTEENLLFHFATNTIGPIAVLKAMLPLLQKSASKNRVTGMSVSKSAVVNISSIGASNTKLTEESPREWLAAIGYRISKAALNMAMRVAAMTIQDQGILIVNICPGWVKTDMGSNKADLEVEESISSMLGVLSQLNESHHGAFLDRDGTPMPF